MSRFEQDLSKEGLIRVRLQNRFVELSILPEAGGKIFDLTDRRSGRNWLWQNPHVAPAASRREASFDLEQDSGGWDEILLSVRPGQLAGENGTFCRIPDHGDLIGRQWQIHDLGVSADGDVICETIVKGCEVPYLYRRRVRVVCGQPTVRISYHISNQSTVPIPWYWCAHPLLAADRNTRIELPHALPFRVDDRSTRRASASAPAQRWPSLTLDDGTERDLAQSYGVNGADSHFASKVFVRSPDDGRVTVRAAAGGERLSLRFDPRDLPWLGLWINNRGWSGCGSEPYVNLGLEPATSPYDCIAEAIANDAVEWLEPERTRSWSLQVELAQ